MPSSRANGEAETNTICVGHSHDSNISIQRPSYRAHHVIDMQSMQNMIAQHQHAQQHQQQQQQQQQMFQQQQFQLQYQFFQQQQQQMQLQQQQIIPQQFVQAQQLVTAPSQNQNLIVERPIQYQSTGQFYYQHQKPIQVQYDSMCNYATQTNPMLSSFSENDNYQINPTPISSFGVEAADPFHKAVTSNVTSFPQGQMRSVTSQGMLLPLVQMPENQKQSNENPKKQMQECMNTIEEALQDPTLADAGKVLLQAMQASSSYMSGLLESRRGGHSPVPSNQNSYTVQEKRFFLNDPIKPRDKSVLFPHLPTWKSTSNEMLQPFSLEVASAVPQQQMQASTPQQAKAPAPQQILAPAPQQILAPAPQEILAQDPQPVPVTPVLSSIPPPEHLPKASRDPTTKPTLHKASCGRLEKIPRQKTTKTSIDDAVSPHDYLMDIIRDRGYSTRRISSDESGYDSNPTPLQLASFGKCVVEAVNNKDTEKLSKLLDCGLSPNPCNQHGDSVLSLICKRADYHIFCVFLDHGCELRVCDSFGRTALHNLAWAGVFSEPMTNAILKCDPLQVVMQDKQGRTPMECVRRDQWQQWIDFWKENADVFWPTSISGEVTSRGLRRSGPVPDPVFAVSPSLASKIASGDISPDDAICLKCDPPMSPPLISLDFS